MSLSSGWVKHAPGSQVTIKQGFAQALELLEITALTADYGEEEYKNFLDNEKNNLIAMIQKSEPAAIKAASLPMLKTLNESKFGKSQIGEICRAIHARSKEVDALADPMNPFSIAPAAQGRVKQQTCLNFPLFVAEKYWKTLTNTSTLYLGCHHASLPASL